MKKAVFSLLAILSLCSPALVAAPLDGKAHLEVFVLKEGLNGQVLRRLESLFKTKWQRFASKVEMRFVIEGAADQRGANMYCNYMGLSPRCVADLPHISELRLFGPEFLKYYPESFDGPYAVVLDDNGNVLGKFPDGIYLPDTLGDFFNETFKP